MARLQGFDRCQNRGGLFFGRKTGGQIRAQQPIGSGGAEILLAVRRRQNHHGALECLGQ